MSPSRSRAWADGLPHPSPRFAPSGTAATSSALYPMLSDISGRAAPPHPSPGAQHPAAAPSPAWGAATTPP